MALTVFFYECNHVSIESVTLRAVNAYYVKIRNRGSDILKPLHLVKVAIYPISRGFFFRTFPGQSYYFQGQSMQDLKVINQDVCEKAYHIYLMYKRLLTFLWYSLDPPSHPF